MFQIIIMGVSCRCCSALQALVSLHTHATHLVVGTETAPPKPALLSPVCIASQHTLRRKEHFCKDCAAALLLGGMQSHCAVPARVIADTRLSVLCEQGTRVANPAARANSDQFVVQFPAIAQTSHLHQLLNCSICCCKRACSTSAPCQHSCSLRPFSCSASSSA